MGETARKAKTAKEATPKQTFTEVFWGHMAPADWPTRAAAFVFVAVAIAAMSFCQLGFWPIGFFDDEPAYLMLMLAPLAMGAFLFGPLAGGTLGLYAGLVIYLHAQFFPLDYYEIYFMTPLNTFGLLTAFGVLAGLLFEIVRRREVRGLARAGLICVLCLVLSLVACGLETMNVFLSYGELGAEGAIRDYLVPEPAGMVAHWLMDATAMALACIAVDAVVRNTVFKDGERPLLSVFRNWMLVVSTIVFMAASAVIFSAATSRAQDEADTNMMSEVAYLKTQIDSANAPDYALLLEGYNVSADGTTVITNERGTVLASDDVRYRQGDSFIGILGYGSGEYESDSFTVPADALLGAIADTGEATILQATGDNGAQSMEFAFLAVAHFDGGYACILRSADMVYANRFSTMASSTLLAALLIVAIGVLATLLLNQVVVRRIDETNVSLGKITEGDLRERVNVRDTAEFTSLSAGINSTVSALKDTIEEVERRNARDLETAKAIQESALPRDFPPFPDIDRFDIYASMKTAKEVGGDFYDFFLIDDAHAGTGQGRGQSKMGFVMADVSGKGIPAALFMMTAKTQIRNYLETGLSVAEAVDAANHQLCMGNDVGMFVTAWIGVLDYETGQLTYVNAGHNPPMLLSGGRWEWVKEVSGMPLGLFEGLPYEAHTRQLEPGDMLYAYTDGVTEAMNAEEALFGEERLEATLKAYSDMNPRSMGVGVRRAITDFTLDCEQSDDITMLALRYGVPPETRAIMILPALDAQLIHVCNFIHAELDRRNAPQAVYGQIDIAAEELFINVCHYAYPDATPDDPGEVRIGFEYAPAPPTLTVTISDDGVPYDPLAKEDAVTPDDIADVPIGGLGILMAKRSVDDMRYERAGESNVVTFSKSW